VQRDGFAGTVLAQRQVSQRSLRARALATVRRSRTTGRLYGTNRTYRYVRSFQHDVRDAVHR